MRYSFISFNYEVKLRFTYSRKVILFSKRRHCNGQQKRSTSLRSFRYRDEVRESLNALHRRFVSNSIKLLITTNKVPPALFLYETARSHCSTATKSNDIIFQISFRRDPSEPYFYKFCSRHISFPSFHGLTRSHKSRI